MADRTVAIVTASSNSGFQCLQDLMAYKGDLELKIKAAFRTEERAEEYMEKLSPGCHPCLLWNSNAVCPLLSQRGAYLSGADTRKVEVVTGVNALQKESLAAAFADAGPLLCAHMMSVCVCCVLTITCPALQILARRLRLNKPVPRNRRHRDAA
eukprot:2131285-Rhodomonas_salina.4